jgi:hypothetical protein
MNQGHFLQRACSLIEETGRHSATSGLSPTRLAGGCMGNLPPCIVSQYCWARCPWHRLLYHLASLMFVPNRTSWIHYLSCWFTTSYVSCLVITHLSVSADSDCSWLQSSGTQASTLPACQGAVGGRRRCHGWFTG